MKKRICAAVLVFVMLLAPLGVTADVAVTLPGGSTVNLKYSDISGDGWYIEYLAVMQETGLMTGTTEQTFEPSGEIRRAQFATILWRMAGEPKEVVYQEGTFPDVKEGELTSWYTTAVAWANAKGIMTGYTNNGYFGPNDDITREQIVTTLWRFVEKYGFDNQERSELTAFPDGGMVTGFAQEAMRWAVANRVITGDQGMIKPQGSANRAECAKMLTVFLADLPE